MKETELHKRMLREVRQLLADLEGGNAPANPAVEKAVRDQVAGQMELADKLVRELRAA